MNYNKLYNRNYNKNIKNFLAILNNISFHLFSYENNNIFTVRQIIDELAIECNSNRLEIKRNIKFFTELITDIKEKTYLLNEKQKNNINLLLGKLNEPNPNFELIFAMCEKLKKEFCQESYFCFLIDNLKFYIKDDLENNYKIIKELTEQIFIELMYQGYDVKGIQKKIFNIFEFAKYDEKYKLPNTLFPMDLIEKKHQKKELVTYINNMTVEERIDYIKKLYSSKKNIFNVVMSISGLVIDEKIVKCNKDIFFYNPKNSDPLKLEKNDWREDDFDIDYTKNCNACITVKAHNIEHAYHQALKILENYIDILKITSILNNYKINDNKHIILDENKQMMRYSSSIYKNQYDKRTFEREIRAITDKDIFGDSEKKRFFEKIIDLIYSDEELKNKNGRIILNSIKMYSEALDSSNEQVAFLKYWSAIESLFEEKVYLNDCKNKVDTICEILSVYMVNLLKYEPLHRLYKELEIATKTVFDIPSAISLSKDTLEKLAFMNIKKDKNISLDIFINDNDEISKQIDDYYYNSKIINIKSLYTDTNVAFKTLNENKNRYKNNIIMTYRIRNQIIHDAYCNDIPIKFYLPLLKELVNSFLNDIIKEYSINKNKTINDIIYSIYTESVLFINNSKEESLQKLIY